MARPKRQAPTRVAASRSPARGASSWALSPPIIAVLLSLPSFAWPFLWDDFDFLAKAMILRVRDFLPDTSLLLYRPLSREVYFALVEHLFGGSVLIAHVLNASAAALCTLLVHSLVQKRFGPRAGLVGALLFACGASIPFLVGWISGIQDLLCLVFLLLAFNRFTDGRIGPGSAFFAAAVLSKETAVALAPAMLVLAARPEPGLRRSLVRAGACIGAVLLVWAIAHPWVSRVFTGHGTPKVNAYVSFRGTGVLNGLLQGLPSLANFSWSQLHAWRTDVVATAAVASLIIILVLRKPAMESGTAQTGQGAWERKRFRHAAALTVLGPYVLASAFIGHWSTYYAAVPMVGVAMLLGPPLARMPWQAASAAVLVYLWLGVSSRVAVVSPEIPAEYNLRLTGEAMRKIEAGFKSLHRDLPADATVYTYVQAQGRQGVYLSLYANQPVKIWYRHPHIELRDPLRMGPRRSEEFLFWISPELDVFEIDLQTLRPRSTVPGIPLLSYQKTLRAYALGLAGRGEIDRSVAILLSMPQESESDLTYDRRTAAALLFAVRRDGEAAKILSNTLHFHRAQAIQEVGGLIAKPVPGIDFDEGALRAFDFSVTDTSAVREIMHWLAGRAYWNSAGRFARRLLILKPYDSEAIQVARTAASS